ncbi:MAG: hypothetical protein FWH02_02640 [Oscillospiraceae bacterium]|nr:hypothetical protein [Oscillospiraceae bacterium]
MTGIAALLASMIKRLITAITRPFQMALVGLRRMLNVNVISAKIIKPLTTNVKKLMKLSPSGKSDYVRVGRYLVFKQLLLLGVLVLCAGVFIYFQVFASRPQEAPVSLMGIKTNVTFRFDDIAAREFTGVANITSFDGGIVYTGDIDMGVCKGLGLLYARDGSLIYEGGFDNNKYNGYGIKYSPEGGIEYEGEFSDNLYHGTGKLYNARGVLLYSGGFAAGQYEGDGKLYDENGGLSYEGTFLSGQRHGIGSQYYSNGTLNYYGDFLKDAFQGSGDLYEYTGRKLFTGPMHEGRINYRALLGATLADIEAAFQETPVIFYQEDGNSCFFYEKAGVIITTDVRMVVLEWEREREDPAEGFYIMPENAQENNLFDEQRQNSGLDDFGLDSSTWDLLEEEVPHIDEGGGAADLTDGEEGPPIEIQPVYYIPSADNIVIRPVASWVVNDPNNPSVPHDTPPIEENTSPRDNPQQDIQSAQDGGSQQHQPDISANEGIIGQDFPLPPVQHNNTTPPQSIREVERDFIDREKLLIFEIDDGIWETGALADKSKIFIGRVTVIGGAGMPEDPVISLEDNGLPTVEDCVAIDFIRRQSPTAFADVNFEIDKRNKLFQRVWSINHADRVDREAFIAGDVIYRFAYMADSPGQYAYYSIETQ